MAIATLFACGCLLPSVEQRDNDGTAAMHGSARVHTDDENSGGTRGTSQAEEHGSLGSDGMDDPAQAMDNAWSGGASAAHADPSDAGTNHAGQANAMASAGSSAANNGDACANAICTADYPCVQLGTSYTCRGQFADWTPAYSLFSFVNNDDGTITDKRSGLTWQQNITVSFAPACNFRLSQSDAPDACTWTQAQSYCASLDLAGLGWRLPTRAELESIVNASRTMPAIDVNVFPGTLAQSFWSSSSKVNSIDNAWIIDFLNGAASYKPKTTPMRVRCVR